LAASLANHILNYIVYTSNNSTVDPLPVASAMIAAFNANGSGITMTIDVANIPNPVNYTITIHLPGGSTILVHYSYLEVWE